MNSLLHISISESFGYTLYMRQPNIHIGYIVSFISSYRLIERTVSRYRQIFRIREDGCAKPKTVLQGAHKRTADILQMLRAVKADILRLILCSDTGTFNVYFAINAIIEINISYTISINYC